MLKNNILNLVLFIVVISLASVIYFSEEENTELEKISTTNIASISAITIQHNKNTTTIIKQQNNHWHITQPVQIAANDFRINSLLKLVNAPIHNKYPVDELNLTSMGLDKPGTTIKFDNQVMAFGITNPATNLRYLRLGDFVYTIEDVYFPLLSSNFSTLVSLNLLPDDAHIEKLILVNQTISSNEPGLWKSNINISADNINRTIDHWQHIQAFGIHEYLQRETLGEVFVYIKEQPQAIRYLITDTDPWLILARPELTLEYHLDIEAYEKLITPH